ncbi:MAG: hypothetical protein ABIY63_08325 [Fibrobacteria bacterium]
MALLLTSASQAASRLGYFTFGPMFHWNFSDHEFKRFSYGLEMAYWNFERDTDEYFLDAIWPKVPGYGLAVGFEFDREAARIYAEPQLGSVLAGASLGAVLEHSRAGGPARLGVQGSGWVNFFAGFDIRYRRLNGINNQVVGLYAKLPALVTR